MEISRRALGKLALLSGAAIPRAFAGANSSHKGVQLGICSYSFRGMGLDELIRQMAAIPMGQLELESAFIEPGPVFPAGRGQTPEQREAVRNWRLTVAPDEIRAIRRRLDDAGIDVYAYNIPVNDTFTEEELDRVFRIARSLGAQVLNSATTMSLVPLLAAAAERHNMRVGLHPSGMTAGQDTIGSGESYRKALALSPRIGANPDLNGWRIWGPDPLAFLREISSRITTLHTHDSKPAEPRPLAVPFGEGANPIREVLRLMQKEKLTFVAILERTYTLAEGGDNIGVRKKGVVELGIAACANCHTRVLPDGTAWEGAQGNFPWAHRDALVLKRQEGPDRDQRALSNESIMYAAPWVERPDELYSRTAAAEEILRLQATQPGVIAREGTSSAFPVHVPSLIGVKDIRYLDATGLTRHRSIADLMRYAIVNQSIGAPAAAEAGFR